MQVLIIPGKILYSTLNTCSDYSVHWIDLNMHDHLQICNPQEANILTDVNEPCNMNHIKK